MPLACTLDGFNLIFCRQIIHLRMNGIEFVDIHTSILNGTRVTSDTSLPHFPRKMADASTPQQQPPVELQTKTVEGI
jgi:hypothetical protein